MVVDFLFRAWRSSPAPWEERWVGRVSGGDGERVREPADQRRYSRVGFVVDRLVRIRRIVGGLKEEAAARGTTTNVQIRNVTTSTFPSVPDRKPSDRPQSTPLPSSSSSLLSSSRPMKPRGIPDQNDGRRAPATGRQWRRRPRHARARGWRRGGRGRHS